MDQPQNKKVKSEVEMPTSQDEGEATVDFTPTELLDFWEGLAAILKQHMEDTKIIVWDAENTFASVHLANVRSAVIEFKPGSRIPVLCLNVGLPSNVAARLALICNRYCTFHIGQVFSSREGNFIYGSDAIRKYYLDVYSAEKSRLEKSTLESEKIRPQGEPLH